MIFLAHRGLWTEPHQRNTRSALRAAFDFGFGVETDVRDRNGRLVLSHDMATDEAISLATMLADYDAAGRPSHLALNIKADGLTDALLEELDAFGDMRRHAFVFDMSVPDTLHYLGRDSLRVFTRHSEFEPSPPLEARAHGIWMDCFTAEWVEPANVVTRLERGQQVAMVSPELHKRQNYETFWRLLKAALEEARLPSDVIDTNLMLCTDFPRAAEAFFSKGPQ